MPGTPRYRGLRRTANREALLGAAEQLFATQGFASVSVDEIVARAGVAKGTFYNHFASKQDIAAALAVSIRHAVRDRIAAAKTITADPAEHLALAIAHFLNLALEHPHRAKILVTLLDGATDTAAEFNRPLRATLEAGRANDRLRMTDTEAGLVTVLGIVSAAIRSLIDHRPVDLRERLTAFVVHGLAAVHLDPGSDAQRIALRAMDLVLDEDQTELRLRSSPTTPVQIRN